LDALKTYICFIMKRKVYATERDGSQRGISWTGEISMEHDEKPEIRA